MQETIRQNNFSTSVYFTSYARKTGADSTGVGENPPTEAPQVSMVVQVAVNSFTGTLKVIISFTSTQVWILVDVEYDSQDSVLYWKFTDIQ